MRDESTDDEWIVVSAADPSNLVGIITSGPRVPATRGNRIVMLNGRPIAARESREIRWLANVDESTAQRAERILCAPGALRRDVKELAFARLPDFDTLDPRNVDDGVARHKTVDGASERR
jgi:ATP-dependent Lhr-like helicase